MERVIEPDETVTTAVVRAVGRVRGRPPESLRPLSEVVEPKALNKLFERRHDGSSRVGGRVSFVYGECHVAVDNGEYLTVEPCGPLSLPPDRRR